jgi:hypothetical protein
MTDTTTLLARRNRALGAGRPAVLRAPAAHRPRRGHLPVRRRRPPLRRHVQQRPLCRSRQPARGRGDGAPAGDAERPQPLPARSRRRLLRTPRRAARPADRERRPQLHRHRGQRGGAAHGAVRHRQARHSSAPTQPITATASWSARSPGSASPPPRTHRRVRAFPFPEMLRPHRARPQRGRARARPTWKNSTTAIADLQSSGVGFAAMIVCSILANEGLPDIPAGFMARAAARVREAGGLVIADEVQAGYAAPAIGGATRSPALRPTSSSPASRWATACRWPPPPRAARWSKRLPRQDTLLQHLRLQPVAGRGRHGGAG